MKTKAAVLYETGKPLVVEDGIEVPALQRGQVLVKLAYSGVCHSQLMEVRGKRGEDRYLPHMLGHEGSGVVLDVGDGVTKVAKGDGVVLTWIKGAGLDVPGTQYCKGKTLINAGGVTTFGGVSVVSENRCVVLPEGMPMDLASLLGCAIPTGAGLVVNTMTPSPSESLAVFGVGGIGLSSVMAASACGCQPLIAVDIDDGKLSMAKQFGATHTVNAKNEDPLEKILELTAGNGVDYSTDAAGRTTTIEQAFESVRNGGGLCVFASHPPAGERISLDPHALISGKQIRGSWGGETDPDRDFPRYAKMYLEGKLALGDMVTHRLSLDEVNHAMDILEKGEAGRVLLEIDSTLN